MARNPVLRPFSRQLPPLEWPTLAVAMAIYLGFGLLTLFHGVLPWPVIMLLGGYVVAWHGSLQHEVVHGHPTPWPWLNEALVLPSLWLWLPFRLYRDTHLLHHREEHITDPTEDPESWYLTREQWQRMGPLARRTRGFLNTAAGRLLLGPVLVMARLAASSWRDLRRGKLDTGAWLLHLAGAGAVLLWVCAACEIPILEYLLLYVYPGTSLTLLRGFAEHEARPLPGERTCAVQAHPLLGLMFLNNNLHPAHHACPGAPWYELPALWQHQRQRVQADRPDAVFMGYGTVVRRYFLSPRLEAAWPLQAREMTGN